MAEVGPCLQDQLWEKHCSPHATRCAHIHNLVLIWREQPLAFGEHRHGGEQLPVALAERPYEDKALPLGISAFWFANSLTGIRPPLRSQLSAFQGSGTLHLRPNDASRPLTPPAVSIAAPGTKLNLTRFILPPRPISCRERSIWHEHARPQQQACQQ